MHFPLIESFENVPKNCKMQLSGYSWDWRRESESLLGFIREKKTSNSADFITGFEPNKYVFHFLDSNHFTHINYRW